MTVLLLTGGRSYTKTEGTRTASQVSDKVCMYMYVCIYNKQGKATSINVRVSLDRLQMSDIKNGLKVR